MIEERGKIIDLVVASLPAAMGRDRQRARIEVLSSTLESNMIHKNNLAEATYLMIGICLQTATGRPMEKARAQDLTRAVAAAYAADSGFRRLDDRRRSQLFYLYTSVTALTAGLSASKDPTEVKIAKALATGTLKEMGIQL